MELLDLLDWPSSLPSSFLLCISRIKLCSPTMPHTHLIVLLAGLQRGVKAIRPPGRAGELMGPSHYLHLPRSICVYRMHLQSVREGMELRLPFYALLILHVDAYCHSSGSYIPSLCVYMYRFSILESRCEYFYLVCSLKVSRIGLILASQTYM